MITFTPGPVLIAVGIPKDSEQDDSFIRVEGKPYGHREMQGMIAEGTYYAYCPTPIKTVLREKFPDALVIVDTRSHVPFTSPYPADAVTAELCVAHLVKNEDRIVSDGSVRELIKNFSLMGGKWYHNNS